MNLIEQLDDLKVKSKQFYSNTKLFTEDEFKTLHIEIQLFELDNKWKVNSIMHSGFKTIEVTDWLEDILNGKPTPFLER